MPMHDWSRVEPEIYHDFHQCWTMELSNRLNAGLLPSGYSSLVEPHAGLTPKYFSPDPKDSTEAVLSKRANRIAIRYRLKRLVCAIEVVSPGHKANSHSIHSFIKKMLEFLRTGANVLVVDPFPPTPRDPDGLHKLIWDRWAAQEVPYELPPDKPLLMASYSVDSLAGGQESAAYLEPFGVGATLPDMPAWLDQDYYVNVPLESAYQTAWENCPADMRYLVEHGKLPDEE